ncbi:helix-turn-helix domain-containing protein [Nocardia farcinica]|uniref:helix-turn-helix domain-containing protein n=1 Tax=Nocardia farcinica TaxID=37329 RepID=UPI0018940E0D|nr:helix-turn-helix domain-containing protein [Nocardia farcinica]MBF6422694.1 helix-turn-helix domain-containing protein [Nocardia farcinica]MBF6434363.1 helix-turn-helix domain-containing protein [Nocardia farcinica]MBF6505448.1 helix-turn-helix domain-containing protein [Nocardia farcinica]
MNISDREVRAAYHCVAEVYRRRQHNGAPIAGPIRHLYERLHTEISQGPADQPDPSIHSDEISTNTAAAILGCSPRWVRKIANDLDGIRVGRTWIFNRATVEEYAQARNAA